MSATQRAEQIGREHGGVDVSWWLASRPGTEFPRPGATDNYRTLWRELAGFWQDGRCPLSDALRAMILDAYSDAYRAAVERVVREQVEGVTQ